MDERTEGTAAMSQHAVSRNSMFVGLGVLALLMGCGGGGGGAVQPVGPVPAVGGEAVVPSGPPMSYRSDAYHAVVQADVEALRGLRIGRDLAQVVTGDERIRELLGSSGIRPFEDFDRILTLSEEVGQSPQLIIVRHHLETQQVRDAVMRLATDRGEAAAWREESGFPVVDWPADTDIPRTVVITADGELVVTTPGGLARVLEVAEDHRLRRAAQQAVDPGFAMDSGVLATMDLEGLTAELKEQVPNAPDDFDAVVSHGDDGFTVVAHGTYESAVAAERALNFLQTQRDRAANRTEVRMVQLDRPLRAAELSQDDRRLSVTASFTDDEMERVVALMALATAGM